MVTLGSRPSRWPTHTTGKATVSHVAMPNSEDEGSNSHPLGPPSVVFSIAQAHTNGKRSQAQGLQGSHEKALQGNKPPVLQGKRH